MDKQLPALVNGPITANIPYLNYGQVNQGGFEIKKLALLTTEAKNITTISVDYSVGATNGTLNPPPFEIRTEHDERLTPTNNTVLATPVELIPGGDMAIFTVYALPKGQLGVY